MTRLSFVITATLSIVCALSVGAHAQTESDNALSNCVADCTGTCSESHRCDCLHRCAFSAVMFGESDFDDACEAVCQRGEFSSADCPGSCVETCNDAAEDMVQLEMCLEDCQMVCGDEAADPQPCRRSCWLTCAAGNASCWERCGSAGRGSPDEPVSNGTCIGICEREWYERVTGEAGCTQLCCAQCSAATSCVRRCTRDCEAGWGDAAARPVEPRVSCPLECGLVFDELGAAKTCAASCESAWISGE